MNLFARVGLLSLALSPLLAANAMTPDVEAEPADLALEFHPLRQAASSKSAGGSLKPSLPPAEFMPIEVSLRLHRHVDGAVSYRCDQDHSALTFSKPDPASGVEQQP
jgi:hypothetical protein